MTALNPTKPSPAKEAVSETGPGLARDVSTNAYNNGLLVLILIGLITRIGYFSEHSHSPSFAVPTLDQKYYDTVARMLLAGEDLHTLHGYKPLLYPLFLAGLYETVGSSALVAAIAIQHLLGIGTGIIVALVATRLFKNRLAGLFAGGLYLLAPLPLMFEGELLVESSYTFLICLALLVHFLAANARSVEPTLQPERPNHTASHPLLWLLGGALTILAAQLRPNILAFLAVYPIFTAWCWYKRRSGRYLPSLTPLLGLIGALCMAIPWGFVNLKQSDRFHLLSSAGGVNLYLGNKRGSKGITAEQERRVSYSDRYQDPIEVWARQEYEAATRAQSRQPENDPIAVSRYWTKRAVTEIRADPVAWLRLLAKKSWLMLWNTEIPNNKAFAFFQQESNWLHWLPVRWIVLLMFVPVAVWAAWKQGDRNAFLILVVFLGLYSAANVAFFISDRYRYPVWPAMAALGGGGVVACLTNLRGSNGRRRFFAAASMLALAAISLPNWAHVQLPTFARDYLFRSIAWSEKGRFAEALQDVDASLQLDPQDASALQQRGIALFALERAAESKVSFQQAIKLSPGEAVTWNNLGVVYERLGETNDALAAFRAATRCEPPSRNGFINLASLEIRVSMLSDARQTLAALEKNIGGTNDPSVLALRSVLTRRNGDSQTADQLESAARSRDPGTTDWILQKTGAH